MIPDEQLADALRSLLRLNGGFYVGFAMMLEIGQLENGKYWVRHLDDEEKELWYKDDTSLDEALGHFLRIRREGGLGYDLEADLNREAGLLE